MLGTWHAQLQLQPRKQAGQLERVSLRGSSHRGVMEIRSCFHHCSSCSCFLCSASHTWRADSWAHISVLAPKGCVAKSPALSRNIPHIIFHSMWAWRWEKSSGSSCLHSEILCLGREEMSLIRGPYMVGLEPGRVLFITQWEKADLKDQCPRESDWEACSSRSIK